MFSKKHFIIGAIFGFILLIVYFYTLPDGKLHIVFCDVGQGDAAYIKTPTDMDMLIDGGPNDKVLQCLGKNMPFYDREIDVVVLSHPQKDHLQGLLSVIQRYNVKYIVIGIEGNDTDGFRQLVDLIKVKKIQVKNLYQGDTFTLGAIKMNVLWPERKWVADKIRNPNFEARNLNTDTNILGLSVDADEINSLSFFLHLQYGDFDALFTGDGDSKVQPEILQTTELPDVEVLKYPHHGSKTGLLDQVLDIIKPELAVFSVGKNPWGHPTKEALELLSNRAIEFRRTDRDGDVEVVSDGRSWIVRGSDSNR